MRRNNDVRGSDLCLRRGIMRMLLTKKKEILVTGSRVYRELDNRANKTRRTAGINRFRSDYVWPIWWNWTGENVGREELLRWWHCGNKRMALFFRFSWAFLQGAKTMKRDVYMGACEASPLKRSRDEIAEVEEEMKCKKRRKLINWKLPSNRMLMEKAVRLCFSAHITTQILRKSNSRSNTGTWSTCHR